MTGSVTAQFKIVIIGVEDVGKTCFLRRFVEGTYEANYMATIGIDFAMRTCKTSGGEVIKLQIWDTAGQERFRTITTSYYRGAHAVIIMYDVTNRRSFGRVPEWLDEIDTYASEGKVILVGNKADSDNDDERQVSLEEGQMFAKENNVPFYEASARDDLNVHHIFQCLSDSLMEKHRQNNASNITESTAPGPRANKKTTKVARVNNGDNEKTVVLHDGKSETQKKSKCLI